MARVLITYTDLATETIDGEIIEFDDHVIRVLGKNGPIFLAPTDGIRSARLVETD